MLSTKLGSNPFTGRRGGFQPRQEGLPRAVRDGAATTLPETPLTVL